MKILLAILKGAGVLLLGFAVVFLVNLPHDYIINAITNGTAKNHVPIGPKAEVVSSIIVFFAGAIASTVVSLLAGNKRKILLIILLFLFLMADLSAVFSSISITSLLYRIMIIVLIPFQVWAGYVLGKMFENGSLKK